jgi:hypothetical protein
MEDLTGVTLTAESGRKYKLTKQAASGAQGVVYEENGNNYMVKLYYPSGSESIDADVLDRYALSKILYAQKLCFYYDLITHPYIGYVMEKVTEHKP